MDLVGRAFGVNPYLLHVQSHLGIKPELPSDMSPKGLAAVAFLKADPGIIEKVKLPKTLPDGVVHMNVSAKPMDKSEEPTSWKFREGSMEFFWPGRTPVPGHREHLSIAESLSKTMFVLAPKARACLKVS